MPSSFLQKIWNTLTGRNWQVAAEKPKTPRQKLGEIFDVVQLSRTFVDSKTFVDVAPRKSLKRIKRDYQKQYRTQLDISRFVKDHFVLPEPIVAPGTLNVQAIENLSVRQYIESMWGILVRDPNITSRESSLLPLPYQYVVPGGRFREIYYWDSYFTLLGLKESGRADLIEAMVKNFAHLIDTYGYIANGNRTYYLGRSQPPVFALMVELLAEIQGEQVYVTYGSYIRREYEYWMRGATKTKFKQNTTNSSEHVVRMPDGELLNRYWDESASPREESFVEDVEIGRTLDESAEFYRHMRAAAESGWDFSSRWMADSTDLRSMQTTDIVPIDLNIILLRVEEILSRTAQLQGSAKQAARFDTLAEQRRDTLQKYLWYEEGGWFTDYVITTKKHSQQKTIAGVFALYGGIATAEQAPLIVEVIRTEFLRPGGLVTTNIKSGQQWDAPNGWAPLQYIAVLGLERYGESELAQEIATRWCALNISQYHETGELYEKYDVEHPRDLATGGEYEVQTGFGWTNGVLLTLMNKYHMD